jgi:geranylgeranyl diphosphate synthase, type I
MKTYFEKTIPLIEKAVNENFPRQASESWINSSIGNYFYKLDPKVWEESFSRPFYDLFDRGGKRLRPVLACLTHDLFYGKSEDILNLATIPEFLHSGILMIDDIEDNSPNRRGKPAIHKTYGINTAINSGNFLYFLPQMLISKSKIEDYKKVRLYKAINEEMAKLHLGQGMDLKWSEQKNFDISISEYLQMCAYKTGPLIELSFKIGGILANADEEKLQRLCELAPKIGIAFQIQDDILNLMPKKGWGKETGEDIAEGKITYLVIETLSNAGETDKKNLIEILSKNSPKESEIRSAISIIEKNCSFSKADNYSRELVGSLKKEINSMFKDSDYKKILLEILDYLILRNK